MCERFVIANQTAVEHEFPLLHAWWRFTPSYNVSTRNNVPVIRLHEGVAGVVARMGFSGGLSGLSLAEHPQREVVAADRGQRRPVRTGGERVPTRSCQKLSTIFGAEFLTSRRYSGWLPASPPIWYGVLTPSYIR